MYPLGFTLNCKIFEEKGDRVNDNLARYIVEWSEIGTIDTHGTAMIHQSVSILVWNISKDTSDVKDNLLLEQVSNMKKDEEEREGIEWRKLYEDKRATNVTGVDPFLVSLGRPSSCSPPPF